LDLITLAAGIIVFIFVMFVFTSILGFFGSILVGIIKLLEGIL